MVPQRVLSSRGGQGQGVSVALQQLNQSLCHRQSSLSRSLANNASRAINNTSSTSTCVATGNASNIHNTNITDNVTTTDDISSTENTNNNNRSKDASNINARTNAVSNSGDTSTNTNTDNSSSSSRDASDTNNANDVKNASSTTNVNLGSDSKPDDDQRTEGSVERGLGPVVIPSSTGVAVQGLKAVDINEHSAEWLEETRLKQEESVAILSEQLMSMIAGEDPDDFSLSLSSEDAESSRNLVSLEPHRPDDIEEAGSGGGEERERGGGGEGGGERESGERNLCMKVMQCEVLGPYSCSDCTKIRLNERQQREQSALYPGLAVDPRTLVAPDRLKRLTASLPPQLTSQRYRLDCGCAIRMHPDFLFPVIVTDHDIHSRLRSLRSDPAPAEAPERVDSGVVMGSEDGSLPVSGSRESAERGRRWEKEALVLGEDEAEEKSMSPTDMKVTVRYTTPSPQQKGVFLTN